MLGWLIDQAFSTVFLKSYLLKLMFSTLIRIIKNSNNKQLKTNQSLWIVALLAWNCGRKRSFVLFKQF